MYELNKYVLHHLLQNGVLKFEEAPHLISQFAKKLNVQPKDLQKIVTEINEKIAKHLFRIDVRICEISGENVCVFVNTSSDDLCTTFSTIPPVEGELLKTIFEEIMTSNSKSITSILCLNLTNRLTGNISKNQAQYKLDKWFENGYLINDDGFVYLGPRSVSEFEEYFKVQYADRMTVCKLCTDYVYFGKICASCNTVFHKHCVSKYFKKINTCPNCKKEWVEAQERQYEEVQTDSEDENQQDESVDSD